MPWRYSLPIAVLALLAGPARAARIVSLNLCTDQLLALLAPEQILALSPLARDPDLSYVARLAEKYPWVRADAEAVLRLHPDLVLAESGGATTTLALLRAQGVPVVQIDDPENFPAIAATTLKMADLLGEKPRGQALVADMWARLHALPRPATPRSAILWQARGWSAGPGSLGDAALRAAGLRNEGTGGVMGIEAVLRQNPDFLVTETTPAFPSIATDLLTHPALANIPRKTVPPDLLICGGPYSARAVEILAQ